jgi:hypothetical protein
MANSIPNSIPTQFQESIFHLITRPKIAALVFCIHLPLFFFSWISIRMKIKYRKKNFVYIQSAIVPQSFAYSFLKDTFATVKNQVNIHKQHITTVMKN